MRTYKIQQLSWCLMIHNRVNLFRSPMSLAIAARSKGKNDHSRQIEHSLLGNSNILLQKSTQCKILFRRIYHFLRTINRKADNFFLKNIDKYTNHISLRLQETGFTIFLTFWGIKQFFQNYIFNPHQQNKMFQ